MELRMLNSSSLDTSIFIRLFTGDMPNQYKKVVKLLSDDSCTYIVEDCAIIEMVHVLETIYKKDRLDIARDVNFLCSIENVSASRDLFEQVGNLYYQHPKLSFNDCYLAVIAEGHSAEPLWTFDKKLATQLPSAKELK